MHGAACIVAGLALLTPLPAEAFTAGETSAARTAIADVDHGKWDAAYGVADEAAYSLRGAACSGRQPASASILRARAGS